MHDFFVIQNVSGTVPDTLSFLVKPDWLLSFLNIFSPFPFLLFVNGEKNFVIVCEETK